MKVLFIPFRESWKTKEQKETIRHSASSRFRCDWVAKYWKEAQVWTRPCAEGELINDQYDVYIFQKIYSDEFIEAATWLKSRGKKVIFDLCDAEWTKTSQKENLTKMIMLADYRTTSSFYIREHLHRTYRRPARFIPDRLDLERYTKIKKHTDTKRLTVLWYGNRNTIQYVNLFSEALLNVYKELPFELLLVTDTPDGPKLSIPYRMIPWNIEKEDDFMCAGDVVINPHADDETGLAKSDNKTIQAWAYGLPVVSHGNARRVTSLLLAYLKNYKLRQAVGRIGRERVERLYDVQISALEFQQVAMEVFYGKQ